MKSARFVLACQLVLGLSAAGWAQPVFRTHTDSIPNFAHASTLESARAGNWSEASTWNPARLPSASDVVRIAHEVTYDTVSGVADVVGIGGGGRLLFATNRSTRLRVGVLLVMPGGVLEIGTAQQPIEPDVTAEIVIANRALQPSDDPDQWGTGLIVVDGRVRMHGAPKSPAFVRTAVEPLAGQTVIQLEQEVSGWRVGDRVFLPDTRQVEVNDWFNPRYELEIDRTTIERISADGRFVTVSPPLLHDHRGARDADGTPTVVGQGTKLLPHLGNLTRNVVIRSENPTGTRGHTVYTHRADVRIAYVQFQDLGRTRTSTLDPVSNHIGRYPVHIHHVWGPANPSNTGYQFELVGNAVNDSLKWPIAVHGSHFGLIKGNVVYGGAELTGAGIAIEDGSETENLFESNFSAVVRGHINARETGSDTLTPGSGGECFWGAGFNNRFINNVASDCRNSSQQIVAGPGFKFFAPAAPATVRNPRFRGADMSNGAETVSVTMQLQPILEFRGNEVYGGSATGFTVWHLGTDSASMPAMAESVLSDFRVWHVYESAVYGYPFNRLTVDGLTYRVDGSAQNSWFPAVQAGDYRAINLTIRGGTIHAGEVFGSTTDPQGTIRIENVRAVTRNAAFQFSTHYTPGTRYSTPNTPGVTAVLANNVVTAWPGQPLRTISTQFRSGADTYPNVKFEIYVQSYQGQAGNNFRVYWREQATQNVHGGVAPCNDSTRHAEVDGITCVTGQTPPE
jgi:hypothetical protein